MSRSRYNAARAAARLQREREEIRRFYERHPEMAPTGNRGSMSNAEYHESLDAALTRRAFSGTPQLVRARDGSWVQANWGDPRVTNACDVDGDDEYAGYSPSAGEFGFNGDCMAAGHLPV